MDFKYNLWMTKSMQESVGILENKNYIIFKGSPTVSFLMNPDGTVDVYVAPARSVVYRDSSSIGTRVFNNVSDKYYTIHRTGKIGSPTIESVRSIRDVNYSIVTGTTPNGLPSIYGFFWDHSNNAAVFYARRGKTKPRKSRALDKYISAMRYGGKIVPKFLIEVFEEEG